MKNPEYERDFRESDDGYSEQQLDFNAEVAAGEWETLKNFKTYQKRSRQGKIIATYHAVSNRINQLVVLYYKFVAGNPKEAEKLLEELRKLRLTQEILLSCLVWSRHAEHDLASQDGKRSGSAREKTDDEIKHMVPKEVWDLIK